MMKSSLILAAAAASLVMATSALAGERPLNVPRADWLSPAQVTEKLTAQGYTVREIEADDGSYEVEMTDKNGVRVEMHVHPATGEPLPGHDDD